MCGLSAAERAGHREQATPKAERGKFPGGSGCFTGRRWDGDGRDGARAATLVPCRSATMGQELEVRMDLAKVAASRGDLGEGRPGALDQDRGRRMFTWRGLTWGEQG
jgi:hypothetical protein